MARVCISNRHRQAGGRGSSATDWRTGPFGDKVVVDSKSHRDSLMPLTTYSISEPTTIRVSGKPCTHTTSATAPRGWSLTLQAEIQFQPTSAAVEVSARWVMCFCIRISSITTPCGRTTPATAAHGQFHPMPFRAEAPFLTVCSITRVEPIRRTVRCMPTMFPTKHRGRCIHVRVSTAFANWAACCIMMRPAQRIPAILSGPITQTTERRGKSVVRIPPIFSLALLLVARCSIVRVRAVHRTCGLTIQATPPHGRYQTRPPTVTPLPRLETPCTSPPTPPLLRESMTYGRTTPPTKRRGS